MATISFLAGEGFAINDLAGSGLGFYGAGGFGTSVRVTNPLTYQDNTYITDSTGATQGPKVDNIKWVHANSGEIAGSEVHALRDLPNYLATLNVRVTNGTPIQLSNSQVRIYDRVSIDNPPTGVTAQVFELVHPWESGGGLGSGSLSWQHLGGSGGSIGGVLYDSPLMLSSSPGSGGWSVSGANTVDTQHDHYLGISLAPNSIGSKSLGLYYSTEFI